MTEDEQDAIDAIEFADLAGKAVSSARKKARASGFALVEARHDGRLLRVFPDGREEFIKQCSPSTPCVIGTVYLLK